MAWERTLEMFGRQVPVCWAAVLLERAAKMRVNCSKEMQWAQGSSGTALSQEGPDAMEVNLFLAVGRAVPWSFACEHVAGTMVR